MTATKPTTGLTLTERGLLADLVAHGAQQGHEIVYGQTAAAARYGCDRTTIWRILRDLQKRGWLQVTYKRGDNREHRVLLLRTP